MARKLEREKNFRQQPELLSAREQAKELTEKYHAKISDLWRNERWERSL